MKLPINQIIQGNCLEVLRTFPDESVDCVMTSPPYWALRDYEVDGQLGLEPTFQEYIDKLCNIFDEVKRVLKKEGTCWVNMGDTYASGGGKAVDQSWIRRVNKTQGHVNNPAKAKLRSILGKSLLQIPARFSIEMINRGWILRNKIIWHKPNCMPESVKDRFTVDFEEIFFFVKNKKYLFDAESVMEPITDSSAIRLLQNLEEQKGSTRGNGGKKTNGNMKAVGRKPYDPTMAGGGSSFVGHSSYIKNDGTILVKPLRNKRCVWSITTKPFKKAHFATYPEKLCITPIKSGCPKGGIVLDPFMGSGTTGLVAKKLFRKYIGIELNSDYIKIANDRLAQEVLF